MEAVTTAAIRVAFTSDIYVANVFIGSNTSLWSKYKEFAFQAVYPSFSTNATDKHDQYFKKWIARLIEKNCF